MTSAQYVETAFGWSGVPYKLVIAFKYSNLMRHAVDSHGFGVSVVAGQSGNSTLNIAFQQLSGGFLLGLVLSDFRS